MESKKETVQYTKRLRYREQTRGYQLGEEGQRRGKTGWGLEDIQIKYIQYNKDTYNIEIRHYFKDNFK